MKEKVVYETNLPLILFVVFLVLKLTNVIDWSWWWVTSPLWLIIAIPVAVCLFVVIIAFIYKICE